MSSTTIVDNLVEKAKGKIKDDSKPELLAAQVMNQLSGYLPRDHLELILELGGKAKESESIASLLKKSTILLLKHLHVKKVGDGYSILKNSPLRYMSTKLEEETPMKSTARKAPAKKSTARKAPAKKSTARKAQAKKAAVSTTGIRGRKVDMTVHLKPGSNEPTERRHAFRFIYDTVAGSKKKAGMTRQELTDKMLGSFNPPRADTTVDERFVTGYISHAIKEGMIDEV